MSSISSIVSYGLSTVAGGEGISSLSSIVSYGLSSVSGGEGISSLSSIVSYGLSTVAGGQGVSSLSSIVAYGLSSTTFVGSNTFAREFLPSSIGGTDINRNNQVDSIPDAFSKVDSLLERLISKPPKPTLYTGNLSSNLSNIVGDNQLRLNFSNPPAFYFAGQIIPTILYAQISLDYSNSPGAIDNPYSNMNLFTITTPLGLDNPGIPSYINSGITSTSFNLDIFSDSFSNVLTTTTSNNQYTYDYNLYNYSNTPISSNNPFIFKFQWVNNAIYPPGSNNVFSALVNFGASPIGNFTVIN